MCGIFGAFRKQGIPEIEPRLEIALNCIARRGPDSSGTWINPQKNLYFGHRRLAIIDLSPAGNQPMMSPSGRYSIVFNGEIYNYVELSRELEASGHKPSGNGDTAMMLAAFDYWGIEPALRRFAGMFAFALWDLKDKKLTLSRDRAGEKPLYYGWKDGVFLFASELGPIMKAGERGFSLSTTAVGHLLQFGYIPSPLSIFQEVYKLPPASYLTLSEEQLTSKPELFTCYSDELQTIGPKKYWDVSQFVASPPFSDSEDALLEQLDSILSQCVKQQMLSDVPLGAFLSGGIDSSTIVALMQKNSTRPVKSFSIGFEKQNYDEAPYARAVANHLGTEHSELYVTERDALDVVPHLPDFYSEPFADSSQIPTFLVSKLTRQHVTVSLSGDGGDELFGGYQRYLWTQRLWDYNRLTPKALRQLLASTAEFLPTSLLDQTATLFSRLLPASFKVTNAGSKIQRALALSSAQTPEDLYLVFLRQRFPAAQLIKNLNPSSTYLDSKEKWVEARDLYTRLMWLDLQTYLPDDILVKVDRAAMAVSLESRAPFLDFRVMEFALQLPTELKIRNGKSKYILRRLLNRYVPTALTERPKMGFGVPLGAWLNGELRSWANELLAPTALAHSGFLNEKLIGNLWKSHQSGNHSNQYLLWHVLMFQAWFRANRLDRSS